MGLSFSEWLEAPGKGFYVREAWDVEKGRMVGVGKLHLFPHQARILDEALTLNLDAFQFKYETVLYSCIKKSGKTSLAAAVGAWYAEEVGPAGTEIYVIANDLEQSEGRVMRDIKFHYEQKIAQHDTFVNTMGREVRFTEKNTPITTYRIELPNGTFIQALAQSYKSSAGSRHALTLWDELWGVTSELSRRMWDEMTPIATVSASLRFIATYAGFENESDLLWDLYLKGVDAEEHPQGKATRLFDDLPCYTNKRLFCYWDHEPRMPWQTQTYYDQQLENERPAAFLRLHMNQWVTSHEAFVPVEWYDFAAKAYHAPATLWTEHPFHRFPVVIGVDAGQKRDSSALVGVGYDAKRGKVGELFHYIWSPTPGNPVDLDVTVEKELLELYNKFNVVLILYDPTHLIQTMIRLKRKGLPVQEYTQSIPNMIQASQLLYDLLKNKNLETYPDEVARRHIQMATAETSSRGFRIVKNELTKRNQIDYSVSLAMACYGAVKIGGVDISIPVVVESPYSDATAWAQPSAEMHIPRELRSD